MGCVKDDVCVSSLLKRQIPYNLGLLLPLGKVIVNIVKQIVLCERIGQTN